MSGGPQVAVYRPPSRGAVPYKSWKDDASCQSLPAEWFELDDQMMDRLGEAPEEQHLLISKGLKVCNTCPVKKQCLSSASKDDKKYTTRGGQPPEGLFMYPNRDMAKRFKRDKECKQGHDEWSTRKDGIVYCVPCKRESDRRREKNRPPRKRNRHPKVVK